MRAKRLFDFLNDLIYYKDAELLLLRVPEVEIDPGREPFVLRARAVGEALDPDRHHTRVDVKAVTLHKFSLEQADGGWTAFVVLDI